MTIAQLKSRCGYGQIHEGWAAGFFIRPVAVYLTWILVQLRLSANAVTVLSILCCLQGCICIALPNRICVGIGIALYLLGLLLDSCDGDLARYHGKSSVKGIYLDNLGHILVLPLFELAIAIFLFHQFGRVELIIAGAVGMVLARNAPWLALCETMAGLVEKEQVDLLQNAPAEGIESKPLPAQASLIEKILDLTRPPAASIGFLIAIAIDLLSPTRGWVTLILFGAYLAYLLLLNALRIARNVRGDRVARYCRARLERASDILRNKP